MLNSAFDFKPVVPNRIMFRPLKAEAYASFGSIENEAFPIPHGRQLFNQAIAQRMISGKSPSSATSRAREFLVNVEQSRHSIHQPGNNGFQVPGMMGNIYNLYNSRWGLQFNIDIPWIPQIAGGYVISPRASFAGTSDRFNENIWGGYRNLWCHGNQNNEAQAGTAPSWGGPLPEPAGAVGIIGAVSSAFANNTLKFSADCKLGMWSWGGVAMGVRTSRPSWGKGNGYRDFQTTNLFVKIYHAWPREQMIYDPRYFAVHHFNAGINDELDSGGNFVVYKEEVDITQNVPGGDAGETKSYKYEVDIASHPIDLRLPSAKERSPKDAPDINKPSVLGFGTRIYGTRADDGSALYESLTKSQWNIDPQRRGKLLPYNFRANTVGIPKFVLSLPRYSDGINADGVEEIYSNGGYAVILDGGDREIGGVTYLTTVVKPFYDISKEEGKRQTTFDPLTKDNEDVVMIIKNPGEAGYKAGDTFVCSDKLGSSLLVMVNAVEEGTGKYDGKVAELAILEVGNDFGYSGFTAVEEDKPVSSTSQGIKLFSGGSQPTEIGKGFDGQLVRGEVMYLTQTDHKPVIATASDYHRLSIKSDTGDTQTGLGSIFGLKSGTEEVEIEIENKSVNSKYDLFFHFHNDISHTVMLEDWKGGTDRAPNDEQWIDLTITAD